MEQGGEQGGRRPRRRCGTHLGREADGVDRSHHGVVDGVRVLAHAQALVPAAAARSATAGHNGHFAGFQRRVEHREARARAGLPAQPQATRCCGAACSEWVRCARDGRASRGEVGPIEPWESWRQLRTMPCCSAQQRRLSSCSCCPWRTSRRGGTAMQVMGESSTSRRLAASPLAEAGVLCRGARRPATALPPPRWARAGWVASC
jgi:hypothetical protein